MKKTKIIKIINLINLIISNFLYFAYFYFDLSENFLQFSLGISFFFLLTGMIMDLLYEEPPKKVQKVTPNKKINLEEIFKS